MNKLGNLRNLLLAALCGVAITCSVNAAPNENEADASVPSIIDQGFQIWAKRGNASYATDFWRKGGLMEDDRKPNTVATFFGRIDRSLGNYKSHEIVSAKKINASAELIYIAINFERGAVYARFHLYRTEKGWVVQNMDFSTKPEAIMPWLAFEEPSYSQ